MTITPAAPKVLNYTLFQGQSSSDGNECRATAMDKERSSGRRKQSYPTKANNVEEVIEFFLTYDLRIAEKNSLVLSIQ